MEDPFVICRRIARQILQEVAPLRYVTEYDIFLAQLTHVIYKKYHFTAFDDSTFRAAFIKHYSDYYNTVQGLSIKLMEQSL